MKNAKKKDPPPLTSDENFRYVIIRDRLSRLLDDVLSARPHEKSLVGAMAVHEQIGFLGKLKDDPRKLNFMTHRSICYFLEELEPHRDMFQTAQQRAT